MGQLCEEGVPGNCSEPESHKGKERRMRGHLDGSGLKRSEGEMHLGGTAGDEEEGLER